MEKKDKNAVNANEENQYRGVDINKADDNKVNPELVKQETKELNHNPRNNDM